MADPNAEQSTVDSAKQDIAGAIRMGQSTARSAKTISKAAAEAASGNVAGAVVTVAKDPETLKKLLIILMLPVLIFSLLGVFSYMHCPFPFSRDASLIARRLQRIGGNMSMMAEATLPSRRSWQQSKLAEM